MQLQPTISRENLSDAAEDAIRDMIIDGRLAAGVRLNEVHLSKQLGVSRTPLREALNRLTREHSIESRPRLGYFVKPLTLYEFEHAYNIRPILDPAALQLAGIPDPECLLSLEKLNQRFARTKNPKIAVELDDEWHTKLLAACPNSILLEMIRSAGVRTRRYELALMRETKAIETARGDHETILAALNAGDLDGACMALKQNLQNGKAPIIAWLKARQISVKG